MTPRTSTNRAPGSAAAAGSVRPSESTYALKLSDDELERYKMMAARARVEEHALWSAAGIVSGAQVADVGCGPGAMLVTLAEVVGPTGHVIGVDADPAAVGAARVAFAAARLRAAIAPGTVRRGQADATGIPPGSVDAVVLRHVLAHNGGSEQRILDHLATLVRPGGRVYVLDTDLTSTGTAQGPPVTGELHERYVRWHRNRGNDPRVGRRLGDLTRRAGLTVLEERAWTVRNALPPGMRGPAWAARDELVRAGLATVADVRRWDAAFGKLDRSPERPESSATVFAVVGRRPA